MLVVLFWVLVGFCIYTYAGYPLLLLFLSLFRKRGIHRDEGHTPTLSIIVPAYNEEAVIVQKLDNLMAQEYPADHLQVLVASDGSTDATEQLVAEQAAGDPRITLLALPRKGKATALNTAVTRAEGEVLVFTDATAILAPCALRNVARDFADPSVGGICGNHLYNETALDSGASRGEMLYWHYDKVLKQLETRVGNAISAVGSFYAIRRRLYVPISDPAASDDFFISTRVVVQGSRLVFEPTAIVYEDTVGSASKEFYRKARIVSRGLRGLFGLGSFLLPWKGGIYAVQVISHKLLRHLVPFVLPLLPLVTALILRYGWFYQAVLTLQLAFCGLAVVGYLLRARKAGQHKLFYVPYYFVQANLAAVLGWLYFVRNQHITVWQPER